MTQNYWGYKAFPKTQIFNFLAAADQIVSLPVIPCQIYCLALLPTCARLVADKRGPANTRPASSGGIPTLSQNTVSHHTERYTRPAEIVRDTLVLIIFYLPATHTPPSITAAGHRDLYLLLEGLHQNMVRNGRKEMVMLLINQSQSMKSWQPEPLSSLRLVQLDTTLVITMITIHNIYNDHNT